MLTICATRKLLDRVGSPVQPDGEPTTLLGTWYATALFWRPQVVLLVNEPTLLPVLLPLAPSSTLAARIPEQIAAVLAAHGTPAAILDEERHRMRDCMFARTAKRSVVGIMNEFSSLAEVYRDGDPGPDLLAIALRLATTPCGPLYRKNVSPDRELAAFLASLAI